MGERMYTQEEYKQMNDAVLEALMIMYNDKSGFNFEAADERALQNITEQRYNRDTGKLETPFGGYPLRKKMEEYGPLERMKLQRKHIFNNTRRIIRALLQEIRKNNQNPPESKEEETKRFWEIRQKIRTLYMLPLRWERSGPDDRGGAWFEYVTKGELYKVARTQQNIEAYGKEGKELFDWMVDEMTERGADEDTTVAEVFGELNGTNGG